VCECVCGCGCGCGCVRVRDIGCYPRTHPPTNQPTHPPTQAPTHPRKGQIPHCECLLSVHRESLEVALEMIDAHGEIGTTASVDCVVVVAKERVPACMMATVVVVGRWR
jgi:hypothetical protein